MDGEASTEGDGTENQAVGEVKTKPLNRGVRRDALLLEKGATK